MPESKYPVWKLAIGDVFRVSIPDRLTVRQESNLRSHIGMIARYHEVKIKINKTGNNFEVTRVE